MGQVSTYLTGEGWGEGGEDEDEVSKAITLPTWPGGRVGWVTDTLSTSPGEGWGGGQVPTYQTGEGKA